MVKCRHCRGEELRKDGIVKGKQRYKCKQYKRTTRENVPYYEQKCIWEKLEGVPNPLIIKWIRNCSKILKELIAKATVAETIKNA